ncbi:penicillin-binding protein 2 [Neobacillus piezotolerans]|uniref:serine-type D-Ala-D-Ala carboxypeptidase n=1 Tax=Neobacillus piezotolerans TaxID=2259171 RepID=A0A3D8GKX9_9BACI|nr:penicillin-binding protein 2 [Neobacillus piezotolerans]RDU35110.1 penicillin-binding protein 2 [Neobacillus piezotolerans]
MWKKRLASMTVIGIIAFFLLFCRLAQIQLIQPENFSSRHVNLLEESVRQRAQTAPLDDGRGSILDRNGISIGHKAASVLILFPFLKNISWESAKVAVIIGISEEDLLESVKQAKQPFAYGTPEPIELSSREVSKINALKIPGVFAARRKIKEEEIPASQLLGVVGQNEREMRKRYPDSGLPSRTPIGVSGLEKRFDPFLIGEGDSSLVYHVDGQGKPLFGANVRLKGEKNPFYPANIRTTIDLDIQRKAEQLADSHGIKKGGIVLLDIETNSILALVSRPGAQSGSPFASGGNQMLKEQIMGSVFKTAVAAAAIENGLDDSSRLFDCSRKINGEPDTAHNYGMVNFSDSFAISCNYTFAKLARELKAIDPGLIEEYAAMLSLTGGVGWEGDVFHFPHFRQLDGEEGGRVFLKETERMDDNFVSLTGIGQKEVRATPLAVANMMATIARNGEKQHVRAVSAIEYKNGTTMYEFPQTPLVGKTVSEGTARKLQQLLRHVVEDSRGTGRWFSSLPYQVAGKSGTAETGKFVGKEQLHNKWFAGYFPYGKPKFALVAVNLDVKGNEGGVNPLFADIVNFLYSRGNHE